MSLEDLEIMVNLGVNGAGKTTLAEEFLKEGGDVISFGEPLRDFTSILFEVGVQNKEDYEHIKKEFLIITTLEENTYQELTFRNALERTGDALKNIIDPKILLKLVKKSLKGKLKKGIKRLASDDVRVPMELEFYYKLKKQGANVRFFWCDYTQSHKYDPNSKHSTEVQAQYILSNYHLQHREEININTIEDILSHKKEILKGIKACQKKVKSPK